MGWGFIGDAVEAVGDGLQAVGDGLSGVGQTLTGDFDGARKSFSEAGGHLADMGGNVVEAATGAAAFTLAPGLYVAKQAWDHLDEIGKALNALSDRVSSWLDSLFNPLQWIFDRIKDVFKGIWDVAQDIVKTARDILRGFNAPETLAEFAKKWREGPGKAMGGMVPVITQRVELTKIGWNDMGGQAYAQGVPNQVKAVASGQASCTDVAKSLEDTSKALLAYYTDCGGLVGRIYAATHGSPGSLFSLEGLMSIMNGGLGNIFTTLQGLIKFAEETQRIQQQMADTLKNKDGFVNGEWPMAQTGIAIVN